MMQANVDAGYRELCNELGLEPLSLQEWIDKLRAEGVTNVSFELWEREPDRLQAWNPKWLGGAAGTGKGASDLEAAARCWMQVANIR